MNLKSPKLTSIDKYCTSAPVREKENVYTESTCHDFGLSFVSQETAHLFLAKPPVLGLHVYLYAHSLTNNQIHPLAHSLTHSNQPDHSKTHTLTLTNEQNIISFTYISRSQQIMKSREALIYHTMGMVPAAQWGHPVQRCSTVVTLITLLKQTTRTALVSQPARMMFLLHQMTYLQVCYITSLNINTLV